MKIREECKDWQLEYVSEYNALPSSEEEIIKKLLHQTGDIIAAVLSLEDQEDQNHLLMIFFHIIMEAHESLREAYEEFTLMVQNSKNLEGRLNNQLLFGCSLKDALMNLVLDDEEKITIEAIFNANTFQEHYSLEDEEENDDDRNEEGIL